MISGYCRKNIKKDFYKKTGQASKSLTCFVNIGMPLRMIPVSSDSGFVLRRSYGIIGFRICVTQQLWHRQFPDLRYAAAMESSAGLASTAAEASSAS